MVWALLDAEPGGDSLPAPPPWQPEPLPAGWQLLVRTGRQTFGLPRSLLGLAGRLGSGVVAAGREWLVRGTPLPPLPLQAPATPFNTAVSGRRWFRSRVLPLDRIRRLKAAAGATVNEVVLAVCAGGLRRYLLARAALPERPLIAAVPISIRREAERHSMGNQVSAMLVDLATDEDDALERLQRIRTSARHARCYTEALCPEHWLDLMPSAAGPAVVQLYLRLRGPDRLGPWFNLFITNVPGPRRPRYLLGAELQCNPGTAPLFDGLGLILVITSYRDTLSLSATGCPQSIPDAGQLMICLEDALLELETALTVVDADDGVKAVRRRR
jgi:WS/DGAT/MGAT family acyltransferase